MWKENRLYPKLETATISDGYEDICDKCENWGEACESCNVSIPIECEMGIEEITMDIMTICGIPVGFPYEISRKKIT